MSKHLRLAVVVSVFLIGTGRAYSQFIFGTPQSLGPEINSSLGDFAPSSTGNGLELYFSSTRRNEANFAPEEDIFVVKRISTADPWGPVMNLGSAVNNGIKVDHPSVSADGLTLLFNDYRRDGGFGSTDLWVTTRETVDSDWSPPENLGNLINTEYFELMPDLSADGLELYFARFESTNHLEDMDIYASKRSSQEDAWQAPQKLSNNVNSGLHDGDPSVSDDGRMLFFSSSRDGGANALDIFVSFRESASAPWGPAVKLPSPVNSTGNEWGPDLSGDGKTLYYSKGPDPGPSPFSTNDLWQVAIGLPSAGDFNRDGVLDAADVNDLTMMSAVGTNSAGYDLNNDTLVDSRDVAVWVKDLFGSWLGDANLDFEFNSTDLTSILASGRYASGVASTWSQGDFNGDGVTDSTDLMFALADGGYEQGPRTAASAVPEPSASVPFALALAFILRQTLARRPFFDA